MARIKVTGITTPHALYQHISRAILDGEFQPNERLLEIAMAEKYGVSRNTLREAFQVLIQDGLLIHYPHRGVFVRAFTVADLEDLYLMRRLAETSCMREIFRNPEASERCLTTMRTARQQAETAMAVHDWKFASVANTNFHMAIFTSLQSERIERIGNIVLAQARLVFMASGQDESDLRPYIEKNCYILKLLEAGNIDAAIVELEMLIDRSCRTMTQLLEDKAATSS